MPMAEGGRCFMRPPDWKVCHHLEGDATLLGRRIRRFATILKGTLYNEDVTVKDWDAILKETLPKGRLGRHNKGDAT